MNDIELQIKDLADGEQKLVARCFLNDIMQSHSGHVRLWINSGKTENKNELGIDYFMHANLEIADCSRKIDLDLAIVSKEDEQNVMQKIERLEQMIDLFKERMKELKQ